MSNKMHGLLARAGVVVGATALVAANAQAEGLADITAGISVVDVIAGVVAVATLVGGVLVIRMGAKKILGMIK